MKELMAKKYVRGLIKALGVTLCPIFHKLSSSHYYFNWTMVRRRVLLEGCEKFWQIMLKSSKGRSNSTPGSLTQQSSFVLLSLGSLAQTCPTSTPSPPLLCLPALISRVSLLCNRKTQTKPHGFKKSVMHGLEASCKRGTLTQTFLLGLSKHGLSNLGEWKVALSMAGCGMR